MSIRARNLLYAAVLLTVLVIARLAVAQEPSWPAPVVAGGAVPVGWNGVINPSPTDWVGLYAPEAGDLDFIEWVYVSCSQTAVYTSVCDNTFNPKQSGTCGLVIPSSVPPGIYELRFYANDGYTRLATSPRFEVLDGGLR